MSNDINVTDGTILESLNNKIDYDGGNYAGSGLETVVNNYLAENTSSGLDNKITNCLLEVPQNIKLELKDGVLTLKAGSIVTVPNGFEADGSPKFDYVTVDSDLSITPIGYSPEPHMVFVSQDVTYVHLATPRLQVFSGTTTPTVQYTVGVWYDTANNIVKYTNNNGATWTSGYNLPLALVNVANETGVTSIDQTFNGMGYIGSTVWVDKGVKGLIPNGRNEDGTLRNIENTTSNVFTETATWVSNNIVFSISSGGIGRWGGNDVYYNEYDNFNYFNGSKIPHCFIGTFAYSNGITSFQPKQPIQVPDIQDVVCKSGDTMTGDLAINKTTTTAKISLNSDRFALNATPESSTNTGSILFTKQGVNSAIINNIARADGGNGFEIALRSPDNTVWKSLYFTVNPDNTTRFSFPMCTTKATTTSTAGTSLVAVVVQNYKNGNSWYRVWSDGWKEQGGLAINVQGEVSITFLKSFSDTNYYINCNSPLEATYSFQTCGISSRTTTGFKVMQKSYNNDGGACDTCWYTCGY